MFSPSRGLDVGTKYRGRDVIGWKHEGDRSLDDHLQQKVDQDSGRNKRWRQVVDGTNTGGGGD